MGLQSLRRSVRLCLAGALYLLTVSAWTGGESKPLKLSTTADHTKFKELQREFAQQAQLLAAADLSGVLLFITPLLCIIGLLYLFHGDWSARGPGNLSLEWVVIGHAIGAFLMLAFFASHFYPVTTGHTVTAHIKAMITGRAEADLTHF